MSSNSVVFSLILFIALVILREPIGILPPPFNPSLPIKFKYSLLLALFLIFSPILFDTLISLGFIL